jgi:hypothetical protein
MANLGGRPLTIDDDLIEAADKFVDDRSNVGVQTLLPTIEGMAVELDISRETIYDWESKGQIKQNEDGTFSEPAEIYVRFSDIVRRLRAAQAEKLLQNALAGRYNPVIAKLMLSKHGYIDKKEQDITSKGEQVNTIDPVMAANYAEYLKGK